MKCARHPDVETNLSCGRCGDPICPKCMVQTPVGARCPRCARLFKIPTYNVPVSFYFRAVGVAILIAAATGVVWPLLIRFSFFYLNLVLAAAIGYGIAEAISLVTNRKRGRGLAAVAGGGVVLAYAVAMFVPWGFHFGLFDLLALGLGVFVAVSRLR